jgi:hypothetical protein
MSGTRHDTREMKHFRISIHSHDPKAYEVVEEIARRVEAEITHGSPNGTSGYDFFVDAEQYDDRLSYPIDLSMGGGF